MINYFTKKLVLIPFFVGFFFSSVFAGVFGGDCSASTAACVYMDTASGVPVYENSMPEFDSQDIALEDVISNSLYVVNVDVSNWDLTTSSYKKGFIVTASAASSPYLVEDNFYMLESVGTQDFTKVTEYFVQNDSIKDDLNTSYLLFENYGSITQQRGDFINQGVTIINEGSEYMYTPFGLDNVFYSEILQIGGSGGAALLNAQSNNFAFSKIYIENAELILYNTNRVLIQGAKDREVNMFGNVTIELHKVDINNSDLKATLNTYAEGDYNAFFADDSKMVWDFSRYVEGEGPSMYFTCSSSCDNNSINLDNNSEIDLSTLSLTNVSQFNITLTNNSRHDVEHYELINSNIIYDLNSSASEFSLSFATTNNPTGTVDIDSNSSFTLNSSNSTNDFYATNFTIEGDMELNFVSNSQAEFFNNVNISTVKDIYFNFENSAGVFDTLNMSTGILYMNLTKNSQIQFSNDITGGGEVRISVKNNTFVYFINTNISTKVSINQEVYLSGLEKTLLRFDDVNTFLDDDLEYRYFINATVKDNDFKVQAYAGKKIVLMQIKNDGPRYNFPYKKEVNVKINESNASNNGGVGWGESSFSVLINDQGSRLIDYVDLGSEQYAEFGIGILGIKRAQDQYGEDEGLLTLTTIENRNGYAVAVVFDNIIFSTTDTGEYRVSLFNLVINNSRTVPQLGQTLNSLNANITLSKVLYGASILEMSDEKNSTSLLDGDDINAYVELRDLSNDNFEGSYLAFGSSYLFFKSARYRFGISGFFSPYSSSTIYDSREQSSNFSASLFGAIQIGKNGGAITLDTSFMYSATYGKGIENLTGGSNTRIYKYGTNFVDATFAYNFGKNFSQRVMVSTFFMDSSSYKESSSDLMLNVATPSYYNAFLGYHSKLLDTGTLVLEAGVRYYFQESQKGGIAGFVNDPTGQKWSYQYILLDSQVEFEAGFGYKLDKNLNVEGNFSKRGTYNDFGIYLMYRKNFQVISDYIPNVNTSPQAEDELIE